VSEIVARFLCLLILCLLILCLRFLLISGAGGGPPGRTLPLVRPG
jgi:hypothetical protein